MKATTVKFYRKQILPLGLFIFSALSIWFFGPLIAIAGHTPLAPPTQRIYVITSILLLWALKMLFLDTPAKSQQPSTVNSDIAKKMESLQGRFFGAIEFLKKTMITRQQTSTSLIDLPWYLLIGPKSSGKTSLLANSGINFILAKQFKPDQLANLPSSDVCDWWATRELVMVDVPGTWLTSPPKTPQKGQYQTHIAGILWQGLLKLIKKTPPINQLNGVVIALNLPELLKNQNNQQRNQAIHDLRKRMGDLRTVFGTQLPFYLVLTKCDLLPGFAEFFGESSIEELSQGWGITIPRLKPNEKLVDIFNIRFNALIKRINKQVLWRIHQERNPGARPFIKDFPLHVERMKETITNLLKSLSMPDLRLHGVYLTSAVQKPAEENATFLHQANNTSQSLHIMRVPRMPTRAYFIKQTLIQGILHTDHQADASPQNDKKNLQNIIYAASITIIIAAGLILGRDFQQSVHKTYSIQNDLARYQLYMQQPSDDTARLVKALPLLDALQQATTNANQHVSFLKNVLSFYSNRSQQTASTVYLQALQTIVLPEIKNDLERYLQTASNKNPEYVYTALKAYLMLADEKNRQADFIANTLNRVMPSPLNKQATAHLTSHIASAFAHDAAMISLDPNLIAQVRKQLTNLPTNELAMVILKNHQENNADSAVALGTNVGKPAIFISNGISNHIPNMFTQPYFQNITTTEIPTTAAEALKGNWVLGSMIANPNQPPLDALVTQLRNQYTANYIDIWESLLANIKPNAPKNLLQSDEMIVNLTNNNSPLLQLLQTIRQNTGFSPIAEASPKLQALNNLSVSASSNAQSPLYQVFVDLRQLHSYLQTVLTANNISKSAFEIAVQRMQNSAHDPVTEIHQIAEQNPEPMKTWLNTIANQSWDFILQEAAEHIQNAWQEKIIPVYNTDIMNRYPFNLTARNEVNLVSFANFLGHQGQLANFYIEYLKPFINDSVNPWNWRIVDNRHIPFTDKVLANLQHAALLQQIFFPNKDNRMSLVFTLQPVALEPSLKRFSLNINGAQVFYQKNAAKLPRVVTWPGNYTAHSVSFNMVTGKNQMTSSALHGDWAWFRLVSKTTQGLTPKKELILNFAANGHSAKYLLLANGQVNPFVADNLTKFALPQDLIE